MPIRETVRVLVPSLAFLSAISAASAADYPQSRSWAGYEVVGATFKHVAAKWRQPTVLCKQNGNRVSFWVAIDGGKLRQDGTIAICDGTGPAKTYKAWWEVYAASGSVGAEPFTVAPGDEITASVDYKDGQVTMSLRDETNGQSLSETQPCSTDCLRDKAEWIVESPGGGQYGLADFGKLPFEKVDERRDHPNGAPDFHAITMISHDLTLATPGDMRGSGGGRHFDVTWNHP
jgi:hypothetical protein